MDHFSQARMGIQLAQQGRRAEALNYLRSASQQEPPHPEVWLWLAHVSPTLEEYRYCVQQALIIAPNHMVARQMDAALRTVPAVPAPLASPPSPPRPSTGPMNAQVGSQPIVVDARLVNQMQRQRRKRSRRQVVLTVIAALMVVGLVGAILLVIGDNIINGSDNETNTPPELTVVLRVDTQEQPLRFVMSAPISWVVADPTDTRWQQRLTSLANFPEIVEDWERYEADLDSISINPASDSLETPLSIVETDPTAILESDGYPLRLQLIRFGTIYASMDDTSCAGLQQLADERQTALAASQLTTEIIENQVVQQSGGRCVYLIHYFGPSPLTQEPEHVYVMYVPVGATSLAEWHLTVVDARHDQYRPDIENLLDTLRVP